MLIGKLHPGDSFGETTVLKNLPMPCSVTTDSHVVMGTISTLDVYGKKAQEIIQENLISFHCVRVSLFRLESLSNAFLIPLSMLPMPEDYSLAEQ